MARTTTPRTIEAQIHYFGGLTPSGVIGVDEFVGHDASQIWDDEGVAASNVREDFGAFLSDITSAVERFREQQAAEMRAYGAAQVQEAILDFFAGSCMELGVIDGRVVITIDASVDGRELRPMWYLDEIVTAALDSATDNHARSDLIDALERDWDDISRLIGSNVSGNARRSPRKRLSEPAEDDYDDRGRIYTRRREAPPQQPERRRSDMGDIPGEVGRMQPPGQRIQPPPGMTPMTEDHVFAERPQSARPEPDEQRRMGGVRPGSSRGNLPARRRTGRREAE